MAEISVPFGREKEYAQKLLALAGSPRDVRITHGAATMIFVVPDDVADAFMSGQEAPDPERPRRRPGRPRLNRTSQSED